MPPPERAPSGQGLADSLNLSTSILTPLLRQVPVSTARFVTPSNHMLYPDLVAVSRVLVPVESSAPDIPLYSSCSLPPSQSS